MATASHLYNTITLYHDRRKRNCSIITLNHIIQQQQHQHKLYVNDNKVRLKQVIKQCTGLCQLAIFCIYYFMLT